MSEETRRKIEKIQYVRGALGRLMSVARDERFDMLQYLLETALQEADDLEKRLRRDDGKSSGIDLADRD